MPFIESIRARNILSFDDRGIDLELRDLNVIVGANASGKSNLISLLSLLQAAPTDIRRSVTTGGGIREWLWKGSQRVPVADISVRTAGDPPLAYDIAFTAQGPHFALVSESLARGDTDATVYSSKDGKTEMLIGPAGTPTDRVRHTTNASSATPILPDLRGPAYPEITALAAAFESIAIHQDWDLGRNAPIRQPQPADLPGNPLWEDARNLAMIINQREHLGDKTVAEGMKLASPGFERLSTYTSGGVIQLFVHETGLATPTPSSRLSQGTLQWLCLLVILLDPNPPSLVCLEEPEKGLHPDLHHELARLLRDLSVRTQVIVTTHSDILVDALSDTPVRVFTSWSRSWNRGSSLNRLS